MSSTPKWYCRRQSQSVENAFGELIQLERDLRCITKRIMIEVKKDMFSEHVIIIRRDTVLYYIFQIIANAVIPFRVIYWRNANSFFSLIGKLSKRPGVWIYQL